jgi:hypothetical protein
MLEARFRHITLRTLSVIHRSMLVRQTLLAIAGGACLGGCGGDRSAARPTAHSPSASTVVADAAASRASTTDAGVIAPIVASVPIEAALVATRLTRFGSLSKACEVRVRAAAVAR